MSTLLTGSCAFLAAPPARSIGHSCGYSTFATNALAAEVGIHALARIMGTSVGMIERHYGTLLDGALESITARLDALDTEDRADEVEE